MGGGGTALTAAALARYRGATALSRESFSLRRAAAPAVIAAVVVAVAVVVVVVVAAGDTAVAPLP